MGLRSQFLRMADHMQVETWTPPMESAETAYRRIARRKLTERGCAPDKLDERLEQLLRTPMNLRLDLDEILGRPPG